MYWHSFCAQNNSLLQRTSCSNFSIAEPSVNGKDQCNHFKLGEGQEPKNLKGGENYTLCFVQLRLSLLYFI